MSNSMIIQLLPLMSEVCTGALLWTLSSLQEGTRRWRGAVRPLLQLPVWRLPRRLSTYMAIDRLHDLLNFELCNCTCLVYYVIRYACFTMRCACVWSNFPVDFTRIQVCKHKDR